MNLFFCSNKVAEVGFEQNLYSVTEGNSIEICLISSNNVQALFLVNITIVGESAQSEWLDYDKSHTLK